MLKTKVKLSLQDLQFLHRMLQAAVTYYRGRVVATNMPREFAGDLHIYLVLDKLSDRVATMVHNGQKQCKNTASLTLNDAETCVFVKAEIPVFNNQYFTTIKHEITEACRRELHRVQALIMAQLEPAAAANPTPGRLSFPAVPTNHFLIKPTK